MRLAVDHDRGRLGTQAQAIDGFQRNGAACGGTVKVATEFLPRMLGQRLAAHGLTGFGAAHFKHNGSGGCVAKMRIKADYAVNFGTG